MDDDDDQRPGFPLQLWTRVALFLPGDIRRRAARLIAKADRLYARGKRDEARVLYEHALAMLEQLGVHHLSKKVKSRLLEFE